MADDTQNPAGDEIARLGQALSAAQKKIQILGSVTRHDINNQLTIIMGYNDLLLGLVEDEKTRKFLAKNNVAARKITRILAYSKVFGSIGVKPPEWQSLDAIVHRAADEADLGAVRLLGDVQPFALYADPLVTRVFTSLFNNTAQHGKHATAIQISLLHPESSPVLVVEDNGIGIPEEKKGYIFDRGFGELNGWGLFVAREILAETGMTIKENGLPGTGARFEIAIPRAHIRTSGQQPDAKQG